MRFNPISEKDAAEQASGLWPDGTYDYEVKSAADDVSKAGNEQIKMEVWIFNESGNRTMLFDYLSSLPKWAWKIRHFASSCGLIKQYETGTLMANELEGRTGRLILSTQAAQNGFPAKNIVKDYVKLEGGSRSPAPRSVKTGDLDGDDIPF